MAVETFWSTVLCFLVFFEYCCFSLIAARLPTRCPLHRFAVVFQFESSRASVSSAISANVFSNCRLNSEGGFMKFDMMSAYFFSSKPSVSDSTS